VLWRYRVELTVLAMPVLVWVLLARLLPPLLALVVFIALVVAVSWGELHSRAVWRWVRGAWFRRKWDRACRLAGLHNLDERTPTVAGLELGAVGERFTSVVPPGGSFGDLDSARDRLAAYLHVRDVRVAPVAEDKGRAVVTVVRRDPLALPVEAPWPLLEAAQASVWEPVPVGIDEDGEPVAISLPYRNVLVGGEPGGGKSVAVSQLVAVAALDPTVDLWLLDGKRVELGVWRDSATAFVDTSRDDAIGVLHRLQGVIDERLNWLDAQPGVRRKITRADGQRVQVVVCDEYAFYTTTGDRKQVREFEAAFTDLVARGRAVGVVVILATQKPHSDVISTGLRDLFAFRWALRCTTPQASDTILGQGWASRGYSAANLDLACPGVGLLLHERGLPVRCRTHFLDDDQVEALAARAANLRRDDRGRRLRVVT
jgi:DNA segregation ATPase FtsK/SpoIIIE-like protein